MTTTIKPQRLACRLAGGAAASAIALALGGPAMAQTAAPTPSDSLAINLVRLLVQQGVITQAAADQLIAQAEAQTAQARAAAPAATAPGAVAALPPPADGVVRVPYVPQVVRDQIRDEVKAEVLAQAKAENWAQPNAIPGWVQRMEVSGDVRFRSTYEFYPRSNIGINDDPSRTDGLIDYQRFNAFGPTNVNPAQQDPNTGLPVTLPLLNTRTDRFNQLNVRARFNFLMRPTEDVLVGIRLATGNTDGPVSTNQALGGGLSKKEIWLDRAYFTVQPVPWAGMTFGRGPNPYLSTTLVWDEDVNFDGFSGSLSTNGLNVLPEGWTLAATGGAFPLEIQNGEFPIRQVKKQGNRIKWLFGYQAVANWRTDRFDWKLGAAYYDFRDIRGFRSQPCPLYTGIDECSTDFSRPAFMQKGNTLFLVRNIDFGVNLPETQPQPQFAGLTFDYNILNLTTTFDYKFGDDKHFILTGDFARNMRLHRSDACRYGVNFLSVTNVRPSQTITSGPDQFNYCSPPAGQDPAVLQTGRNAWQVFASIGDRVPFSWGKWNILAGYMRLEADSVVDAYNDSDFHLGGTNAKGWYTILNLGLFNGANLEARWFSANEIHGAPYSVDVGQVDLNVRF